MCALSRWINFMNYILDASALFKTNLLKGKLFTTQKAADEVLNETERLLVSTKISSKELVIIEPSEIDLRSAYLIGSNHRGLSNTDISILALALSFIREKKDFVVLTDDFELQNALSSVGIQIRSINMKKISSYINWVYYCPSCGRTYNSHTNICSICGTKIKRKSRRRTNLIN